MTTFDISGIFSAAATPLDGSGMINHTLFSEHCKTLIEEGCDGVSVLGSTGEANSFGLSERIEALDKLIESGLAAHRLLPGTGQTATPDTIQLTKHAVNSGARGVLLLPPFYYKDVSDEGLFRSFASVIEGVGDDRLRIILYHIPQFTGVPIAHSVIARLRDAFPGIVAGIKDSGSDFSNLETMARNFPGFSVLAGADPFLLPLLKCGGAGCITGASNFAAADLRIIFNGWNDPARKDEVDSAHARAVSWRNLAKDNYVQLPTTKAILARRRNNNEWLRVRPPFVELNEVECADVWSKMEAMGA